MNPNAKCCVRVKSDLTESGTMVINKDDYKKSVHGDIVEVVQNDRGEKGEPTTGIPTTKSEVESTTKKKKKARKKKKKVSA